MITGRKRNPAARDPSCSHPSSLATGPLRRAFLAWRPPAEQRQWLARARPLQPAGVQPLAADDLHLTLRYLGDLDAPEVAELCARLQARAAPVDTIEVQAGGGLLLPPTRPRLLALRVEPAPALQQLVTHLDALLAGLPIAKRSQSFLPHITLLRGASMAQGIPAWLQRLTLRCVMVDYQLMCSNVNQRTGPRYRVVTSYRLR
ncbi:MAG TPA: RNA 2',3'-cyclic phosphodiesterase [Gammaproteobacteria bacterium]|nr:RNA 2',3'-cyclic phosphodiesterase [Gammaproteobacteria bacterium]